MRLVHLLAIGTMTVPAFAVIADDAGRPTFRRVVSMGVYEVPMSDGSSMQVCAGILLGGHMEPADWIPGFVGYAEPRAVVDGVPQPPDAKDWAERCKGQWKKIEAARKEAAKPKLYVPPEKKLVWDDPARLAGDGGAGGAGGGK